MDEERIKSISKNYLELFISAYKSLFARFKITAENLLNADEVPCNFAGSESENFLTSAGAKNLGILTTKKEPLRTFMPFVSAAGEVWMVVVIFKLELSPAGKKINKLYFDSEAPKSYGNFPIYYTFNQNGFMTYEIWAESIRYLIARKKVLSSFKEIVLLLDRHVTHLHPEMIKLCLQNNIYLFFLPPHTSHWIQPLDNGPNASVKIGLLKTKRATTNALRMNGENIDGVIQFVLPQVLRKYLTVACIRNSFESVGLFPINIELIRKNAGPYIAPDQTIPDKSFVEATIETTKRVAQQYISPAKTPKKAKMCLAHIGHDSFDSEQMLEAHAELAKTKATRAQNDAEKKDRIAQKRAINRSKKEEQAERAAKRRKLKEDNANKSLLLNQAKRCHICDCHKGRAHDWWICGACNNIGICLICYTKQQEGQMEDVACPTCGKELISKPNFGK